MLKETHGTLFLTTTQDPGPIAGMRMVSQGSAIVFKMFALPLCFGMEKILF